MENNPKIVIVSCSNTKPRSLIKLITKTSEVKEDADNPGLFKHPWLLDTKYYTAEVNLLGVETDLKVNVFNNTEAFILHMDSNKASGLDDLNKWVSLEETQNLEVKLLVSNYCTADTKITKRDALEWCLEHDYEFIELYPAPSESEQEDDFKEKVGVDRVIEALQSHTWSNLIMKNSKILNKSVPINYDFKEANRSDKTKYSPVGTENVVDDFTELFSQLHTMKDSLQSMPMSQRKQCAEQMVTAFWKAIGGEEEELFDL